MLRVCLTPLFPAPTQGQARGQYPVAVAEFCVSAEGRGYTGRLPSLTLVVTRAVGSRATDLPSRLVSDPGEGPVRPLAGRAGHPALDLGRVSG